jgi:hypothetical protein
MSILKEYLFASQPVNPGFEAIQKARFSLTFALRIDQLPLVSNVSFKTPLTVVTSKGRLLTVPPVNS